MDTEQIQEMQCLLFEVARSAKNPDITLLGLQEGRPPIENAGDYLNQGINLAGAVVIGDEPDNPLKPALDYMLAQRPGLADTFAQSEKVMEFMVDSLTYVATGMPLPDGATDARTFFGNMYDAASELHQNLERRLD